MTDSAIEWQFEHTVVAGRSVVEVFRRSLSTGNGELQLDMEPFFNLPSIAEYKDATSQRTLVKGVLKRILVHGSEWTVEFGSSSAMPLAKTITSANSPTLTVWRVDRALDAIQVYIKGTSESLYLQTGGAGLLRVLSDAATEPAVDRLLKIFNEPITQ